MNRPEVRALKPTELVMALNKVPGWTLSGDGDNIAIEKTFEFAQHTHALLFVNGVGWLSEKLDHHPELVLNYRRCVVRWRFGLRGCDSNRCLVVGMKSDE